MLPVVLVLVMNQMARLNLSPQFCVIRKIKDAVHDLLARDGLILGTVMVFRHWLSGLLPYGEICELSADSPT